MISTRRRLRLSGPRGHVSLVRTPEGVVRVEAARFEDLPYGLGWAHAHDRLVQMVLVRTLGRGQAAEHLEGSREMVAIDRFMRRMGFHRDAREQAGVLSEEARSWCQTYCDGVNEFLRTERRPLELWLVGYRPDPWTAEDILLTIKLVSYMGLAQSQQTIEKFVVQAVQAGVDPELLKELFGPHLDGFDASWLAGCRVTEPLVPPAVSWMGAVGAFQASNNWAVAAARSAKGGALFASDPHLECDRLPAVWYETVLASGRDYLMGATIPGIPGVLIGRNARVAWGVTYGFMDQIDYFVEEVAGGRWRRGEEWLPFETREETIRIRGGGQEKLLVQENVHGVLEGEAAGGGGDGGAGAAPGRFLCRAWSGHRGNVARTAEGLVGLAKATSVREAMEAVKPVTISLNWVLADRDGAIGYQQSGVMPRRAAGWSGLYPVPGWDPKYDWKGWVDPSELNHRFNPADGFVATANEDWNAPGGPPAINMPMGDYRARRIREVLASLDKARLEDLQALQLDLVSLQARDFMPLLAPHLPATAEGRAFAAWDFRYTGDSLHATRFEAIYRELTRLVFGDGGLGRGLVDYLWDETVVFTDFFMPFDRVLLRADSAWYRGRSRDELFSRAVKAAFDRSPEPWGKTRRVMMRNLFFAGKLPRWLGFDVGPVTLSGNRATVLQGAIYRNYGLPATFAPSVRFVTDLSTDEAHTALAGGPSGRRTSRWYASDVPRWLSGTYKLLKL